MPDPVAAKQRITRVGPSGDLRRVIAIAASRFGIGFFPPIFTLPGEGEVGFAGSRRNRRPLGRLMIGGFLLGVVLVLPKPAYGQLGGGMPGGGMPGGGAPGPPQRAKFRDAIHETDGLTINREKGDTLVAGVRVIGNRIVGNHVISQQLQTRKGRFYDDETVLADVGRLLQMGSFEDVNFETTPAEQGMMVTFKVRERRVITEVIYHGNQRINDREIRGRSGLVAGDPLSPFSIENAQRRLLDYYREEGFSRAAITHQIEPSGRVIFRINEGQKERIWNIRVLGADIVSESRLKKIIKSRDSGPLGVTRYLGNVADLNKINRDVEILQQYMHNLGFLTATVGRSIRYHEDGDLMDVTFHIDQGPRFEVGEVKIVGTQWFTEESLRARMELKAGDMFSGTQMRLDIGEIIYGYGENGFIYADVEPKTILRDESGTVDLVYKVTEGERWRIGQIHVRIDGDPQLMKESTILNLMELREGDVINRRKLEADRRRLGASPLLESDMNVAEAPDIKVVPREEWR